MKQGLVVVEPVAAVIGGVLEALPAPLWFPWPVPPGWKFTGLAHGAVDDGQRSDFTIASWTGVDPFGDPIEALFVSEEAGAGVGGAFAGLPTHYPPPGVGEGAPHARFTLEGRPLSLWVVEAAPDRAVYTGEAAGRWLWVILYPAEAGAIVVQPLTLVDARGLGAEIAVVPLGELSPRLLVE